MAKVPSDITANLAAENPTAPEKLAPRLAVIRSATKKIPASNQGRSGEYRRD